jgi:hypothetical protein
MDMRVVASAALIVGLLVGLGVGAFAMSPGLQQTRTVVSTSFITTATTEVLTTKQTVTEVSYTEVWNPHTPRVWNPVPAAILNPDFEYSGNGGTLTNDDWMGYAYWYPELTDKFTQGLGIVNDGTKTVVVMHPLSPTTSVMIWQPLSIDITKKYVLTIRMRNIATCAPDESRCGDSIVSIRLTRWELQDIQIDKTVLDTRSGWVEKTYDITKFIRESPNFKEQTLAYLVIDVQAGGPRDVWWGEWTAIDYVRLEVT